MFVVSRGNVTAARDPCWAAELLGKSRFAFYSAAFWENERFRSV